MIRLASAGTAALMFSGLVVATAWRDATQLGARPWLLTGLQVLALWSAGRGRWWGWLLGGSVQLPWIAYAVVTTQLGFIPGCAVRRRPDLQLPAPREVLHDAGGRFERRRIQGDHMNERPEHVDTLVIGGGQAGLAVGYHLSRHGLPFLIVDANKRVGDAWRNRWDSLRLFTPNVLNGLPGMPYPGDRWDLPTKDEFADYLERYAKEFDLPVQTGVKVKRLARNGQQFAATADDRRFEADNVVVAMSSWQQPRVPEFASELDPGIVQLHAADYRNPGQLREGDALVVGAGNSGAEIALELSQTHRVLLSGQPFGVLPFRPTSAVARVLMPFVGRIIFHRVLTTDTPIGRKARPKMLAGDPLIRVKPKDLAAAGVERVPRTVGVVEGLPQLEDGRRLDVANVVWCTGFHPDFSWIDLPVLGPQEPKHNRGIVEDEPGLYFVGLKFLYSKSSEQIHGVGRDAARIAAAISVRHREVNSGGSGH